MIFSPPRTDARNAGRKRKKSIETGNAIFGLPKYPCASNRLGFGRVRIEPENFSISCLAAPLAGHFSGNDAYSSSTKTPRKRGR